MVGVLRLPESSCPGCGKILDSATNLGDEPGIDPGDYVVCITCGTLLRYDANLHVKKATKRELRELQTQNPSGYVDLVRLSSAIRLGFNPLST